MSDPYIVLRQITVSSKRLDDIEQEQLAALLAERDELARIVVVAGLTDVKDNPHAGGCPVDATHLVGQTPARPTGSERQMSPRDAVWGGEL